MYYTNEEDLRFVSAWLNNSTDSIERNFKKPDRYWKKVVAAYNRTTPSDYIRDLKLLKSHWYKITKKVACSNECFNQMNDTYASGRSDDQLMEQALELYGSRCKHHFTFLHWSRAVRDSPKWNAHISAEGQGIKGSSPELVVNKESQNVRPVGCKEAKMKAVGSGAAATAVEEQLEKLVSAQTEICAGIISDMKELSAQKVEAAKLAYMAAKEKNWSKMLDRFSEMLTMDTSKMEPWAKEAHVRAVTVVGDELFGRGWFRIETVRTTL